MRTRLGGAALLLLLATTAAADPLFQVRLRELGVTEVDESNATGVAVADTFERSGPRVAEVAGAALPEGLSAFAHTTSAGSSSYGSGAEATVLFDDLVVTNVANPGNAAPIDARLRFEVAGTIQLGASGGPSHPLNSNGRLIVGYRFGAANTLGGQIWLYTDPDLNSSQTGAFIGVADPANVAGIFTTATDVEVQVGVPQLLGLELEVIANVGNLFPNTNEAIVDFTNGLSFPTDGSPVLVLPEGYTADAPSAGIVDNVFVAPEAGALAAAAAALAALAAIPHTARRRPEPASVHGPPKSCASRMPISSSDRFQITTRSTKYAS